MSRFALGRVSVGAIVGIAVGVLIVAAVPLGLAGMIGMALTPQTTSSDPVIPSSWSGYGVRTTSANAPIVDVFGSWVVPNVTCPSPNSTNAANPYALASEAIGAGLDHWGPLGNLRMDGVGVVIACVLGNPIYRAWFEQAPLPAVLIPMTVLPGDVFQANVTLAGWTISDQTTPGGASGLWTTAVSVALGHNSAQCVVSRGTALGILPALFKPVPATVATALTNPVEFGSKYAIPPPAIAAPAGCWYSSPQVTGAPGGWVGIGNAPSPPFSGLTFELTNPTVASAIVPGPLATGVLLDDSFIVP